MGDASSSSTTNNVQVLVSGAGPVGLFSAYILSRLGISVKIIDKNPNALKMSKAPGLNSRTLEMWASVGIVDDFLKAGKTMSDFHVYYEGKLTSVIPTLNNPESAYSFGLFLEQYKTEEILYKRLEGLGVTIDRGWELVDTKIVGSGDECGSDDSLYVETIIRRPLTTVNVEQKLKKDVLGIVDFDDSEGGSPLHDGNDDVEYETQIVKSDYLIAAEGGRSVVRHALKIPFPGKTKDHNIILFDGDFESEILPTNITLINGKNSLIGMFPLSEGTTRMLLDNGTIDPEHPPKQEELSVEMFEALARPIFAPNSFKVTRCHWLTYYRVNERRAERYQEKRRIFLAGDAAHVHSPAGGQGLNLGVQDAFNLTWKLALVLHGQAAPAILDTYESERTPVADSVIELSSGLIETVLAKTFFPKLTRRIILTVAPYILPYLSFTSSVQMMSVKYDENAINIVHKSQPLLAKEFRIGQRGRDGHLRSILPSSAATDVAQVDLRLHELYTGPGTFQVVVFASDLLSASGQKESQGGTKSIQGIETTTTEQLSKDIDSNLTQWRSRWAYDTNGKDHEHQRVVLQLFMVHVVVAGHGPETATDVQLLTTKARGEGLVFEDLEDEVHKKYGVTTKHGSGTIVVVRPDGQVGYRVQGISSAAWKDVNSYFEAVLV